MKAIIVAVYSNFVTSIIDDSGMEQQDAYVAGPVGRLLLQFERP